MPRRVPGSVERGRRLEEALELHGWGAVVDRDDAPRLDGVAEQPWCDGNVGMIGISYFGSMQVLAAAERPPSLKAIFVSGPAGDAQDLPRRTAPVAARAAVHDAEGVARVGPVPRTLAEVYRHFGEVDAAGTSPLYERVAVALSESDEALRAIEAAPARKRHPTLILAALHDLALAGRAPALAAAYAAADGDAAAGAAIDTLLRMTDSVVAIAARRQTQTFETATLRRAVSGHRRGGAPGGRERGRADRRGRLGRTQSPGRSRRHHVQQRTDAGRPVVPRAAVVGRSWGTGPSRRGPCPRSSPGSASTSIRST